MYRKNLLYVILSLLVYLATGSSDELLLEEETKMLANNEVLSDKIEKVDEEALILNNTETETTELYENKDDLNKNQSFGNGKEKLSKARSNFFNGSVENIEESTTIDPNHTEIIDITNTTSDFATISKAPVDFVELSDLLKENFNTVNTELSIDVEEYITTEAITESYIKSTEITSEGPYNVNLNFDEANNLQMSDMENILNITTETIDTLNSNNSNSDIFSSIEIPVKTDNSDNKLATTEFPTIDTTNLRQDDPAGIDIVEPGEIDHVQSTDVLGQDYIISQSTEYSSQNITAAPLITSTTDFISIRSLKVETTSETTIEPITELFPYTKTLKGSSIRSSINIGTTEIRNSLGEAVEKKTKLENLSPNSNKNRDFEMTNYTSKVNVPQTRSTERNNSSIATKIRTQRPSKPKQTLLPLNWYSNLVPIYPTYSINPLNYFYNSTNQTLSGANVLPTTLNYTSLLNPPIFNFTNLLSQTLLPVVTTTARHGFFRQNQLNMTKFHFFPLFKLFNATHHFNKTKYATNTQTETAFNATDVLNALFHHKHAKFQQRQTDQDNEDDDGTVFVRRQWYTPLVNDNLERSESVPFLTPIVRNSNNERPYYRNQGQKLLTPVIMYVERGEPYRIGGPQQYREKPKPVKRPTTYREEPYYQERPYNIERPHQVEHAAYYPRPIKTDVQSGPISYESSPVDLSYVQLVIDIDDGDVEYYYRSKQLNATSLKSAEDKSKAATTSLVLEVEVPNPIYKFMKKRQQQQQNRRTRTHSQSAGQGQGQQQRQSQQSPSVTAASNSEAVTLRVANTLDNLTTRQRHSREDNVSGRNQFANRVLCRTPPPVYDSLPATPPPSYTPHGGSVAAGVAGVLTADGGAVVGVDVARSAEVWQSCDATVPAQCQAFNALQCGSNVADYVEVFLPACSVGYQPQQRGQQQLVQLGENAAPTVGQQQEQEQQQQQQPAPTFEAHVQVAEQQQLQQQQQHLRRRRRLHLLQQQRLSNINATSTESTSSSSNCSLSDRNNNNNNNSNNNYHFNNHNPLVSVSGPVGGGGSSTSDSEAYACLPIGSERRRQRRQQRIGRGLRDAYCPDLLHACSLILNQQHEPPLQPNDISNDSSVSNFTATPPRRTDSRYSTEYVEIDEIRPLARDREGERFRDLQPSNWQPQVERAISTPELRQCVYNDDEIEDSRGDVEYQRLVTNSTQRDMGQNLSLRRPRISLTWVLREQQQQQQQQQQQESQNELQTPMNGDDEPSTTNCKQIDNGTLETPNNNNGCVNGLLNTKQRTEVVPTQLTTTSTTNTATTTTTTTTKRYRLKQLPGSTDPLNGYATTPTANMPANALAPQKFFSNQNLLEYRDKTRAPSRELLFVCTPQRLPKSYDNSEALSLAKKRNEIRKRLAAKMATLQGSSRANADGAEASQLVRNGCGATVATGAVISPNGIVLEKDELKSLKGTYSEPSLIAASEGQHRRHRHRKRRERNRGPKFGYEINNVDEFLSKCSLAAPGNIPVVLSAASTLYQTHPGQHQIEIPLPLGMVVNAVFKNQNWLYVQTPHAEEGYVVYSCCLPLGILPPSVRSGTAVNNKPAPCWESNGDIFPRPGGNMTDSEKEIRLRGGTRSDGARTPRGKRGDAVGTDVDATNGNATSIISTTASMCGEHQVDRLYLRAASQPRLVEKAYAQLRSTKQALAQHNAGNDEYVTLQQQQQQHKSKLHVQKHMQQQQQQLLQLQNKPLINGSYIMNGHNGQHLHPKNTNNVAVASVASNATPSVTSMSHSASFAANSTANGSVKSAKLQQHASVLHMASRKQHGLRQTLVAINTDYSTESIVLHKGEIVTLCECRESKDHRQWFYVRTRDGREGYIPAEVAGHGYL